MCLEGATETWGKGVLADHNEDQRKNTVLFTEKRQGLSMTKEGRRGRNRKCAVETNHCCFSCIRSPTTLKQSGRIMKMSLAYFHSFETLSDTLQLWKMKNIFCIFFSYEHVLVYSAALFRTCRHIDATTTTITSPKMWKKGNLRCKRQGRAAPSDICSCERRAGTLLTVLPQIALVPSGSSICLMRVHSGVEARLSAPLISWHPSLPRSHRLTSMKDLLGCVCFFFPHKHCPKSHFPNTLQTLQKREREKKSTVDAERALPSPRS